MEDKEGYIYEAVFLDQNEVENAFKKVTGSNYPKCQNIPDHYHVTTEFKPFIMHRELYGTKAQIHIIGYAYGEAEDDEGIISSNEGFRVEITSDDVEFQKLLSCYKKIWHITGSYSVAAKHTGLIDYSNMLPVDISITGVFGMGDNEGNVILSNT